MMSRRLYGGLILSVLCVGLACEPAPDGRHSAEAAVNEARRVEVEALVRSHAAAWESGDTSGLAEIMHDEALFAYPRRRVDRATWAAELHAFGEAHEAVRIYIHRIIVDGDQFAVEWQFAATDVATGVRTAVSDAIVGVVADGRIISWKEYLDGQVSTLQREGRLTLEEGDEPFPWPLAR